MLQLRSPPPATSSPSSAVSFPTLAPRLLPLRRRRRGAGTQLGGKTSSAVRASSAAAPGATEPEVMVEVAHREVARALASLAEARLGARLLPSAVPPDVAGFRSGGGAGNAVGSLDVRRGAPGSTVMAPSPLSLLFVRTYRFSCACSLEASLPLSISC